VQKYFNEIYKSNERVLALVRDLLSVSRIDQGRVKNIPQLVDVIHIVKEIVEQLQVMATQKNVGLRLTVQNKKIPAISIDTFRFHEAVENLIVNAIEYTRSSGKVSVTINKVEDELEISVKDTGIGISAMDQKKLFSKFFRAEKAIACNPEGSGLGLYVVKSYVEGWGGKISAESIEGKGSKFTLSLPIYQKKIRHRAEKGQKR
jgi:two-component system phosphate regulon sensor histidine kinase PhoR